MKISQLAALATTFITMCPLASTPAHAGSTTSPSIPVGSLSTSQSIVRAGSNTSLSWNITYPSVVKDYITVITPSTIIPKQSLFVDVRVLGAGVTAGSSGSSSFTYVPTEALMSYNSTSTSSYKRIFYGTNLVVNPNSILPTSTILTSSQVAANTPLRFGGRYYYNGSWGQLYTSSDGTDNVRTLVNGDVPPSNVPAYNAPSLESFLKPYLDSTGRVQIGPMDVIVFMELTHSASQKSDPGYDLQDMVLLVTFRTN